MNHVYFQIAGITIRFESDLDLKQDDFTPALRPFIVDHPGEDMVTLQRHFELPDFSKLDLGVEIYSKNPWVVYENKDTGHIYYQGILPDGFSRKYWCFADFTTDFVKAKIYFEPEMKAQIRNQGWQNLTGFPTDNIWLAQLLANRSSIYFHSAASILNRKGFLFIGRSEAGKTTTLRMLQQARDLQKANVSILCDETNIVRRWLDGWRVHGTWGHGEESEVSGLSAPLAGIFVLKQDKVNQIEPLENKGLILKSLLSTIYRPAMTKLWWEKELSILDKLAEEVPLFIMHFDRSGQIISLLNEFSRALPAGMGH